MKLNLPKGLKAALLATYSVLWCQQSNAADLTTVITMSQMASEAIITEGASPSVIWQMSDGLVYDFNGNGYLGSIKNSDLLNALKGNQYVTIAAWINPRSHAAGSGGAPGAGGALFGYGGERDGIKVIDRGGALAGTTKGVEDFGTSANSIELDYWQLVAVTMHKNSDRLDMYYMLDGVYGAAVTGGGAQVASTESFAIGSGNSESKRELFQGSIGNMTVFTSTEMVTASDVIRQMGTAPFLESLVWNGTQNSHNLFDTQWSKGESSLQPLSATAALIFGADGYKTVTINRDANSASMEITEGNYVFENTATVRVNNLSISDAASLSMDGHGSTIANTLRNKGVLRLICDQSTIQAKSFLSVANLYNEGILQIGESSELFLSETYTLNFDLSRIFNNGTLSVALRSLENQEINLSPQSTGTLEVRSGTLSYLSQIGSGTLRLSNAKLLFGINPRGIIDAPVFSNDIEIAGTSRINMYGSWYHSGVWITGNISGENLIKGDGDTQLTLSGIVRVKSFTNDFDGRGTIVFSGGEGDLGIVNLKGSPTVRFAAKLGAKNEYGFESMLMSSPGEANRKTIIVDEGVTVNGRGYVNGAGMASINNAWGIDGGGFQVNGTLNIVGTLSNDGPGSNYIAGSGIINTAGLNVSNGTEVSVHGGININIASTLGIYARAAGSTLNLGACTLQAKDSDWSLQSSLWNVYFVDNTLGTTFETAGNRTIRIESQTSGTGMVSKTGAGLLIASADIRADGGITLNAGEMYVEHGRTISSKGDLNVLAGAILHAGGENTLDVHPLHMHEQSTLSISLSSENLTQAALTLTRGFFQDGNINLKLINAGDVSYGNEYKVLTMSNGATPQSWDFSQISIQGRNAQANDFRWVDGTLYYTDHYTGSDSCIWSGAESMEWNESDKNWIRGDQSRVYEDGETVSFRDEGNGNIVLNSTFRPLTVEVCNSEGHDFIFSGDNGSLAGSMNLVKDGNGMLTINTANSYTGGTIINGGSLVIGNEQALGLLDVKLYGGTLDLNGFILNQTVNALGGAIRVAEGTEAGLASIMIENGNTLNVEGGGKLNIDRFRTGKQAFITISERTHVNLEDLILEHDHSMLLQGDGLVEARHLRSAGGEIILHAPTLVMGGGDGSGDQQRKEGLSVTGRDGMVRIHDDTEVTGALYISEGTVEIGGEGCMPIVNVNRLEMGDTTTQGEVSTLNVEAGSLINIRGAETSSYQTSGLILGEWWGKSVLNLSGTLVAQNAALAVGDMDMDINIQAGGTLAVQGVKPLYQASSGHQNIRMEMAEGGRIILGEQGIRDAKMRFIVNGGEIGIFGKTATIDEDMRISPEATLIMNTERYILNNGSVTAGTSGGILVVNGNIKGGGHILKEGAGTLMLAGDENYINNTIRLNEGILYLMGAFTLADGIEKDGDILYERSSAMHEGNGFMNVDVHVKMVEIGNGALLMDGSTNISFMHIKGELDSGTGIADFSQSTDFSTLWVNNNTESYNQAQCYAAANGGNVNLVHLNDQTTLLSDLENATLNFLEVKSNSQASLAMQKSMRIGRVSFSDTGHLTVRGNSVLKIDSLSGSGSITLEENTIVMAPDSFEEEASAMLSGNGTYVLPQNWTSLGGANLSEEWHGTIRVFAPSRDGAMDFSRIANQQKSTIELNGVKGWTTTWNGDTEQNIQLTDSGETAAWTNTAFSGNSYRGTFSGKWSGSGTMISFADTAVKENTDVSFTGDITEWTGAYLVKANSCGNNFSLSFWADAKNINIRIGKVGLYGTLKMSVGTNATFTQSVNVDSMEILEGCNVTIQGAAFQGDLAIKSGSLTLEQKATVHAGNAYTITAVSGKECILRGNMEVRESGVYGSHPGTPRIDNGIIKLNEGARITLENVVLGATSKLMDDPATVVANNLVIEGILGENVQEGAPMTIKSGSILKRLGQPSELIELEEDASVCRIDITNVQDVQLTGNCLTIDLTSMYPKFKDMGESFGWLGIALGSGDHAPTIDENLVVEVLTLPNQRARGYVGWGGTFVTVPEPGENVGMVYFHFYEVPEPTTGTLSLLVLAALAARRRRK